MGLWLSLGTGFEGLGSNGPPVSRFRPALCLFHALGLVGILGSLPVHGPASRLGPHSHLRSSQKHRKI